MTTLFGIMQRIFVEAMTRNATYDSLKQKLEKSGAEITDRFQRAENGSLPIHQARHIIGIERWGTHRLRTAFGEPLVVDEYDSYRPDDLRDMGDLAKAFADTRQATLALIDELKKMSIPADCKVLHNEMQDITIRAWLYYLYNHAYRETRLVRMDKPAQTS